MFTAEFCEALKLVLSQKLMQGITIEKIRENVEQDINIENAEKEELIERDVDDKEDDNESIKLNVKFTVFEGLYYYAPMTFMCQCLLCLPMEWTEFMKDWDTNMNVVRDNWMKFVICGCLGFGVNMASWLVTKITSGLYLKALGTFRNICLVIVSAVLFHEIVNVKQAIGYCVSLIGFMYYNYLQVNSKKS